MNSSPLWTRSPPIATIRSPGRRPASSAGETDPAGVSTPASPETITPSQSAWMPTARPTGTTQSPGEAARAEGAVPAVSRQRIERRIYR